MFAGRRGNIECIISVSVKHSVKGTASEGCVPHTQEHSAKFLKHSAKKALSQVCKALSQMALRDTSFGLCFRANRDNFTGFKDFYLKAKALSVLHVP